MDLSTIDNRIIKIIGKSPIGKRVSEAEADHTRRRFSLQDAFYMDFCYKVFETKGLNLFKHR